jgi:hypothetical protein
MSRIHLAAVAFALACFACGSNKTDDVGGVVDDLPTVPPPLEASTISFELQEQIIPAAGDVQVCHFFDVTTEDMYIKAFDSFQGKAGHHLILFSAVVTDKPGTVRDCSSAEDMIRFRPIVSSVRFGVDRFPEGMAVRVPSGTQLVLQQHYVNASQHAIRVKDVAHLTPTPESEVSTLVGFFGLSDITFGLPPGQEQDLRFDCKIPYDTNVLVMGPHMHEWGTKFKAEIGPKEGPMETLIDVPVWSAEYRDAPPLSKFTREAPYPMRGGDYIRTTCTFKNTRTDTLEFPEEMCATFGYFFPATRGNEEFICGGDES